MSALSNGSSEEFWRRIYCKNWFSDRLVYTIADADIGSLKPLHALFDKHLDGGPHAGEIWTKSYGPN